jgi:hypothetical protein
VTVTKKRLRRLLAAFVLVLFVPGGAATALADSEAPAKAAVVSAADRGVDVSARAAERQRRVEDRWIAEQVHAEVRARASSRAAASSRSSAER